VENGGKNADSGRGHRIRWGPGFSWLQLWNNKQFAWPFPVIFSSVLPSVSSIFCPAAPLALQIGCDTCSLPCCHRHFAGSRYLINFLCHLVFQLYFFVLVFIILPCFFGPWTRSPASISMITVDNSTALLRAHGKNFNSVWFSFLFVWHFFSAAGSRSQFCGHFPPLFPFPFPFSSTGSLLIYCQAQLRGIPHPAFILSNLSLATVRRTTTVVTWPCQQCVVSVIDLGFHLPVGSKK